MGTFSVDFVLIFGSSAWLTRVRYLLVLMGPVGSCKHPVWVRRAEKQHKIKAPGCTYSWIIDNDTVNSLIWILLTAGRAIQHQTMDVISRPLLRTVWIYNFLGWRVVKWAVLDMRHGGLLHSCSPARYLQLAWCPHCGEQTPMWSSKAVNPAVYADARRRNITDSPR